MFLFCSWLVLVPSCYSGHLCYSCYSQRSFCAQQAFTHRSLCTQRSFYTQHAFTQRSFYTQQAFTHSKHLHTASIYTQQAFTHSKHLHTASFYTQQAFTHSRLSHPASFYTEKLLQTEAFTHRKPLRCQAKWYLLRAVFIWYTVNHLECTSRSLGACRRQLNSLLSACNHCSTQKSRGFSWRPDSTNALKYGLIEIEKG